MRTDISRSLTNSPQFAGISAGSNAGRAVSVAGRGRDSVDFGCRSVRMGLNCRMGEELRDRGRICSEDDEKKASGQSQVLPKIPEQRARLTGA